MSDQFEVDVDLLYFSHILLEISKEPLKCCILQACEINVINVITDWLFMSCFCLVEKND